MTREPGATPVGKRLRSILLDVSSRRAVAPRRGAAVRRRPRRARRHAWSGPRWSAAPIVISDRYIDSSVAYQGAGRDLSPTEIARISAGRPTASYRI